MAKAKDSVKEPIKESVADPQASNLAHDEVEITHPDQLNELQDKSKLKGFSGWFFEKKDKDGNDIRVPSQTDKGEYRFVKGAKGICKIVLSILLAIGLFSGQSFAAVATTDESVLGNNRWSVQNDGDLIPGADESYDIGSSTSEVDNLYVKTAVVLNGTSYTSFAAGTDGNWTGDGLTTTLDAAPTKFIATHSTGDLFATGFTVGTGDITGANGAKVDLDTANEVRLIENSDTLKIGFSGDDITIDSTDGGVIFALTDATDGTVDFMTNNDTDDYIQISTTSNQSVINFAGQNGKITAASGSIDFDNENLTTTGTLSSGATTVTSLLIGDETFSVPTDDTIRIASNDAQTIWDVYTAATSDEDSVIRLSADAAADNGDVWQFVSDGGTNSLFFQNNTSGSQATILTLANTGLITTTGDVTVAGTTPLVTIGDGGDEDAGIQINSDTNDFYIASENTLDDFMIGLGSSIGTTPVLTITDTGVATHTGSTDGDLTIYGAGTSASDAYLRLVGDAGADASDRWQLFNDSSAGTLYFQSDISVAGTYVTLSSVDANGDWVFSGTTPKLTIGDAGEEDTQVTFDGNAADFSFGLDDSADAVSLSLGTALGTTEVFKADGTTMTVTDALAVDGVFTTTGASATLGNAIGDITTFTGKIAGATPMSFDGNTADTVYTILSITDPTSSSKTVTIPAVTGTVEMATAATTVITADTTATITVNPGTDTFYTYTIDTDNEDCTLTFSAGGSIGDRATILFITDSGGSGDEVMTFHTTLANVEGTLTLANLTAGRYVISFISDGTVWNEISRTAALS